MAIFSTFVLTNTKKSDRMKRIAAIAVSLFFGTTQLFAQLIDAEPEVTTLCTGGSATLTATLTPPGSGAAPGSLPTTSYAISSIAYAPDPLTAGTSVTLTDDSQTGLIPIGFNFCYFGNTYSQFIIGSNNWVGFQTGETSTWVTVPIPSATLNAPRNTIMGPWQDINPGAGGTVKYALYGTAPFRRLAVSWNNVPMFSCTGQLYSSQIIIYETTNIIETHILNKSLCTTWNSGNAVHGLHNAAGTVAFVVPGRNNTQFTASNEGTRFTPNGTATYTINWYILPANTLIQTNTYTVPPTSPLPVSTINVTPPASPQYYYAEVTGPNGCGVGAPNTDTVVVNSVSLAVDAGPYAQICSGTSTTLSASGGLTYSWLPTAGLSDPNIANPVATPSSTTTYTCTITGAFGCFGIDTVTVAVNTTPFADAGFGAGICSGDNIMLGGNGSGTYAWTPAATLDDPTIATPTATPTATTTYTLTVTNALGCSQSDTVTIFIVNPAADAGLNTAVCFGSSTSLNATGGTSYTWSPVAGLSDPNVANPVATPTATTTYSVFVQDSGTGCSATDSVTITVNPLPIADAGSTAAVCQGFNTTLGASGGINYAWTPTTSISDSTIFNPVASPTTTTTYTVNVTDALGCVSNDTVTVVVHNLPTVSAGLDISTCVGATASFNATGAATYLWTPGASLSDSTIANPTSTPAVAGTYVVVGTDVNGCVDSDTVSVALTGLVITPSASTTVCAGSSTTLNVSGGVSYIWSPAATLSNPTLSNPVATPIGTTTYTVIGTAASGCADTAFVTVSVNALPLVNAGTSLSICNGSTANLSVTGANTYSWSPAGALDNPSSATPISSATSTTLYTVTGTDLNGCVNSDTITVVVHPIPTVSAGLNTSICAGGSATLNATSGMISYSWSPSSGLSSTTTASTVATPAATTTYTVTVMGAGFCTNTAQVTVTVNPIPTITAAGDASICSGSSTSISATGAGAGGVYSWSPSAGLSSPTSPSPIASPTVTTTYTVTGSSAAGCTSTDVVVITVSNALSIASSTAVPETCSEGDGSITAGAVSGGTSPILYSLDGGAGQSSPSFGSLNQGVHLITVTDALGCSTTQTVSVGQISNVNASFTATPTSGSSPLTVNFNNTSSGTSNTYLWDLGDGTFSLLTNPSDIYTQTGTYTVTLIASNGGAPCVDTATLTIEVYNEVVYVVPNIFTPNGDQNNDVFSLERSVGINTVEGEMFNRWGKRIYNWSGDKYSGWDGKINGKTADDGTYYFILTITGDDGKQYEEKGYVQLLGK